MANDTNVEIEKFTVRLNEWRQDHKGRGRKIPKPLLFEAGRLAAAHGIGVVARAAGLNYARVKACMVLKAGDSAVAGGRQKVVAAKAMGSNRATKSPFVEVPIGLPRAAAKTMVVEVRSARGDFIRIEDGNVPDVTTLVCAFLGRSS